MKETTSGETKSRKTPSSTLQASAIISTTATNARKKTFRPTAKPACAINASFHAC
jgi:hypothetical protein